MMTYGALDSDSLSEPLVLAVDEKFLPVPPVIRAGRCDIWLFRKGF